MTDSEAQVAQRAKVFLDTWKAGDAAGLTMMFTEDAVRVSAFGDVAKGHKEIRAAYEKLFKGPMAGAKMEFTPEPRELAPGVVVVKSPMTITPPSGPALKGNAVDIWVKRGSAWLIIEAHPRIFPARP